MFYKGFVDFAVKYEQVSTKKIKLGSEDQLIDSHLTLLSGDSKTLDLKESLKTMANQMKNPFKHIRNWIKGELRRISALLESIAKMQAVDL